MINRKPSSKTSSEVSIVRDFFLKLALIVLAGGLAGLILEGKLQAIALIILGAAIAYVTLTEET
jgi:hypothetical protein